MRLMHFYSTRKSAAFNIRAEKNEVEKSNFELFDGSRKLDDSEFSKISDFDKCN